MHCVGKMKNTLSPMFAALALATAGISPALAQSDNPITGDAQAGSGKIAMCIGCHGILGYKANFPEVYRVPKIAGQSAKYIESVLEGYRKGDRKHPSMRGIAGSLSDQDIADVAAYYANQADATTVPTPGTPRSQQVADLLQRGACISCHGENYSAPIDPSYPKLAGQHPDYLYAALKAYRDDSHATWGRTNPIMAGMVKQYSNPELKQIAQYIGSLPGEVQTIPQSKFR